MATPVGHLLVGALIGAALTPDVRIRHAAAAGALAALIPDMDFIPGALLFGEPSRFHHGVSHSLTFAVLAAVGGFLAATSARTRWALIAGLGYASHLAADMLTRDSTPPYGVPLLWPLSGVTWQSPLTILPNVPHQDGLVISAHNVELLVRELLMFGVPLAVLVLSRRKRTREGDGAGSSHLELAGGSAATGERSG